MTFHAFKAIRHSDEDGYEKGSALKMDSNDAVSRGTDEATTIFEPP